MVRLFRTCSSHLLFFQSIVHCSWLFWAASPALCSPSLLPQGCPCYFVIKAGPLTQGIHVFPGQSAAEKAVRSVPISSNLIDVDFVGCGAGFVKPLIFETIKMVGSKGMKSSSRPDILGKEL